MLTDLGRLAGESATEVTSIVRLVECLRQIPAGQLTDRGLIADTQITVELDDLLFPFNKKSTQKEPQFWMNELRTQVTGGVLNAFRREVQDCSHVDHPGKEVSLLPAVRVRTSDVGHRTLDRTVRRRLRRFARSHQKRRQQNVRCGRDDGAGCGNPPSRARP